MAYGVKHRFEVYSYTVGTYWKVDLAKDGYVGAINTDSQLDASAPLTISKEGEGGGKFYTSQGNVIKGSSATLRVMIENATQRTNFMDFAVVAEKEWKMLIYKGTTSANATLYHELFIQPDVYQFDYNDYPYFIELNANDEVGRLNAEPFVLGGTVRYTDRKSIMYFIFQILGKLGISREIKEIVNVYSQEMTQTAGFSPLIQASIDPTKYVDNKGRENEEPWDCHRVMNDMLKPFGAIMFLGSDNRWVIARISELAAASYTQRIITDATTVASSAVIDSHQKSTNSLTTNSIVTFINNAKTIMDWRWKRARIKFFVGDSGNFVFDNDLDPSAWVNDLTLKTWTKIVSPPDSDFTWTYERAAPFAEVFYMDDTPRTFTVNTTDNYIGSISGDHGWVDGTRVIFTKTNGASLPTGIDNDRPYYLVNAGVGGGGTFQLAQLENGTAFSINSAGSGDFWVGKVGVESVSYAAQLNEYIDTFWTSGSIQNNNGIKSKAVDILQQAGNTFTLSFYWKVNALPLLDRYTQEVRGYYAITVTEADDTVHYFNTEASTWGETPYFNALDDASKRYRWIKENAAGSFPADGKFQLALYQASVEATLDVQNIQYGGITGEVLIGGDLDIEFIQKTGIVGEDYAYDAPTIELLSGDAPSNIYQGSICIDSIVNNQLATQWRRKGVQETRELTDILLQDYMNNYGRSTIKVIGDLMADLKPEDVVSDANLAFIREDAEVTPKFLLNGGTLNVEDGIWSGEFIEVVARPADPPSGGSILLNTEFNLLLETGSNLLKEA